MHSKRTDLPQGIDIPALAMWSTEAGAMTIETGDVKQELDVAPLFVGLPDNRCQCEHWGYVIKGSLTFRFADRDEVYGAGEVYYAEPGHSPVMHADTEYVEFSPTDALNKTMEVAMGNAAKMGLV
jgi:hypothetical protein